MELDTLHNLSPLGLSLTLEERSGLQVAMLQRMHEESLPRPLTFWGKIMGLERDYLVCYCLAYTDAFPEKLFYYCTTSDFVLRRMPDLRPEYVTKAAKVAPNTYFRGDPSWFNEEEAEAEDAAAAAAAAQEEAPAEENDEEDNEDGEPKEKERFREVHRLAYVVLQIEHDAAIVPLGALLVDATHRIIPNAAFEGLSFHTAMELRAYFHFRQPENPQSKALLTKPGIIRPQDFLDPVSKDKPAGVWTLQRNDSNTGVYLRNLYWNGYFFYAKVGSRDYGGVYIGHGFPNSDLAFMM